MLHSRTRVSVLALLGVVLSACPGFAADTATLDTLRNPSAFEKAYATSFYGFDACGASLTGKVFRDVLGAKFAQCPFSPEARAQYKRWTEAQRVKSGKAISGMIAEHGGLPMQLPGMTTTCHEQTASPAFQQLQTALDGYQRGVVGASAILPGPCDADEIVP